MAKKSPKRVKATKAAAAEPGIGAFMLALAHPLKAEIEAVSRTVLGAAPGITAAVKWNAPSFRTTEFFATIHLRSHDEVQLILHRGAKARPGANLPSIDDPAGRLRWLAKDRAIFALGRGANLAVSLGELEAIVRQWIRGL